MREILFRGKRLDTGEWVEGSLQIVTIDGATYPIIFGNRFVRCGDTVKAMEHALVDPATVGQYTGKTVKTGKVFDGDIGKSIDGLFLVTWDEESAAYLMRFQGWPYEKLYIDEIWDDAEVIGNIHDNPELVKEVQE